MGRQFPRFLLCNSSTAKSKGLFIVHSLEPRFIAIPEFSEGRGIQDCRVIEVWSDGYNKYDGKVLQVVEEIPNWWKYSGIHESNDPRDKVISGLSKLKFLKDSSTHFTIEQVQEVIKIVFPTKAKRVNDSRSSYGLKHDVERISSIFISRHSNKYCSNDTLKEAMANEGFKATKEDPNSPNEHYNISEKELNIISKLGFNRINNYTESESF